MRALTVIDSNSFPNRFNPQTTSTDQYKKREFNFLTPQTPSNKPSIPIRDIINQAI